MLFAIPAVAGYGDWWLLSDEEVEYLTGPSLRMYQRASRATKELVQRYFDPIALVLGLVVITQKRLEMTAALLKQQRIQRELEARREALRRTGVQANTEAATGEAAGGNGELSPEGISSFDVRDAYGTGF